MRVLLFSQIEKNSSPLQTPSGEQTRPKSESQGWVELRHESPSCRAHTLQQGQSGRGTTLPRQSPGLTSPSHPGVQSQLSTTTESWGEPPICAQTRQGTNANAKQTVRVTHDNIVTRGLNPQVHTRHSLVLAHWFVVNLGKRGEMVSFNASFNLLFSACRSGYVCTHTSTFPASRYRKTNRHWA